MSQPKTTFSCSTTGSRSAANPKKCWGSGKKCKKSEVIGFSCWQQTGDQKEKIWETCMFVS